jgi:N-methylhydantoinase A
MGKALRVGVEVGGTFTDLVVVDGDTVRVAKVPSTPEAPEGGALNAIDAAGIDLRDVADLVHGSTVATNAVLERKGARVCLFVTKGTRDLLLLQRHTRDSIYDIHYQKPEPVVPRNATFEIDERIANDGSILTPLDTDDAMAIVDAALSEANGTPYDAVAISLLNSFANPDHEAALSHLVAARFPDVAVTASHEVCREFREYERTSTTALSAYVQPVIERYLNRFVTELEARGFTGTFSIMQSNGGRMPAEAMARNAIAALFSGPAAGVVGAVRGVAAAGYGNLITLDMGGTSTDVSLVAGGRPELAAMTNIDGLPVKTPVVDIVTVGAGGGSKAWVDDGGLLRVGPQSAGAVPGPACYGRGGTEPTVTDAHLIRGTLQAGSFLDGAMSVDRNASLTVFDGLVGHFGESVDRLADDTIRIAESNIVRAIQQISTERGRDPRDYVIVPFGGAGPLHAARVAQDLGVSTVVVPANAGVLSAAGLLLSDYVHYRARSGKIPLNDAGVAEIRAIVDELEKEISDYLTGIGVDEELRFDRLLEMRYVGQAFEVTVTLPEDRLDDLDAAQVSALFAEEHHRIFEFSKPPDRPVEIVSVRLGAHTPSPTLPKWETAATGGVPETIDLIDRGEKVACRKISRAGLSADPAHGPLLIEDGTSTIYVPAGWRAAGDAHGNAVIIASEE